MVTETPVLPAIALPPVSVTTVAPVSVPHPVAAAPVPAAAAPMVMSAAGPDVIPGSVAGEWSTLCFFRRSVPLHWKIHLPGLTCSALRQQMFLCAVAYNIYTLDVHRLSA